MNTRYEKEGLLLFLSFLFSFYINFLCDFPFIQGAWISLPLKVMSVWMNWSNSTIELYSSTWNQAGGRCILFI